jgi:tRNA(fMet)-specific endonuclease VapC
MPIHLLDTDHMSLLERDSPEARLLDARLSTLPPDDVATSIVSYEEQTRGWLAVAAQARSPEAQVAVYQRWKRHLDVYCRIVVLSYDARAAEVFERLKAQRIRVGAMDLKIAAIALANGAIVLTRNLRHFAQIPEVRSEDWSQE